MINIKVMAEIVAQTGATVDSVAALIHKIEHHEKTLVDIGVLRFPDPDHPYFKVSRARDIWFVVLVPKHPAMRQIYRIRLTAWSVSARYLAWQEDSNGITGGGRLISPIRAMDELTPSVELNVRNFRPRRSVLDKMKEDIKDKAVEEAEDIFS